MEEYLIPTKDAVAEFTEKRSRFIGRIWITPTEEDALDCIKRMRSQHWDATHNVYAYIIHGGATRYSDDGEPQGTAGMPVLDALRGRGLENVCCVVTRYFGGILLGTGGLVRAYGRAAKEAAEQAGISMMRLWQKLDLVLPYSLYERVQREAQRFGCQVLDVEYSADICMHLILPAAESDRFLAKVTDVTAGKIRGVAAGEEYRAFPVKSSTD